MQDETCRIAPRRWSGPFRANWLPAAPFALLAAYPSYFPLVAVPIGVYVCLRVSARNTFLWAFLIFASLGIVSQLLFTISRPAVGPYANIVSDTPTLIDVRPNEDKQNGSSTNLLPDGFYQRLHGHSWDFVAHAFASHVDEGFWRVSRYDVLSGRELQRIRGGGELRVTPDETYTLSFYYRPRDKHPTFKINFRTARSNNRAPPQIEKLADDLYRASASYTTTQDDQRLVHGFEIDSFAGDWSHIDIGYVQLEQGRTASPYTAIRAAAPINPIQGIFWWVGTAAIGFFTISASIYLFRRVETRGKIVVALVLGMLLQLAASIIWTWGSRGTGLIDHPNILGAYAVVFAALIWMVGGRSWGLLGLMLSAALVITTGSRTAFLGLTIFAIGMIWHGLRPRISRLVTFGTILIMTASLFFLIHLIVPGRLADTLDWYDTNMQTRIAIWQLSAQAFLDRPIFGVGFGNLAIYQEENRPTESLVGTGVHAHNSYLHVLAENGVLGLVALLLLLGCLAASLRKHAPGFVGLMALALMNLNDTTLFTGTVFYPLLAMAAWAIRTSRLTGSGISSTGSGPTAQAPTCTSGPSLIQQGSGSYKES